jgi:CRISPR-associated endonuclease/helicase Cas3
MSFLNYDHGSICLLPILSQSILVIDEIHSFDNKMFDNLIELIKRCDLPILLMSASLPEQRKKKLIKEKFEVYPKDQKVIEELSISESYPRYEIQFVEHEDVIEHNVIKTYNENKKI